MAEIPGAPSGFTVKEMLTEIVIPDLKAIKQSLDQKADRAEVIALEVRMGHIEGEVPNFVKRSGPVMDTVRDHEKRVGDLEKESIRRGAIVDRYIQTEQQVNDNSKQLTQLHGEIREEVRKGVAAYSKDVESRAAERFSRRDKVLLAFLAVIGALATIISTVFVVVSALHGGGH